MEITELSFDQMKEIFKELGGQKFITVPCLNDNEDWVELLSKWIKDWSLKETLLS